MSISSGVAPALAVPGRAAQPGESVGRASGAVPASGAPSRDPAELARIRELQAIDQRVRAHERAHVAAGGGVVRGGANFGYVRGPDGREYAVSGEVAIDVSAGRTPQETIAKAQAIQRAALAPADPSAQDRQVAAQAARMAAQASAELGARALESDPVSASGTTDRPSERAAALYRSVQVGETPVVGGALDALA